MALWQIHTQVPKVHTQVARALHVQQNSLERLSLIKRTNFFQRSRIYSPPVQIGLKLHFVLFCCLRQNEQNFVLLFDKKPIGFVNKIWILLTKYGFCQQNMGFLFLLFWYKIAKYFVILLFYWFFTFCSVLLFSRTDWNHLTS